MGHKSPHKEIYLAGHTNKNFSAGDIVYFGNTLQTTASSENYRRIYIHRDCHLRSVEAFQTAGGGNPTTEDITLAVRKNGTDTITVGTFNYSGATIILRLYNNNLNTKFSKGDYLEMRLTIANPFVTPPTSAYTTATLYFEAE